MAKTTIKRKFLKAVNLGLLRDNNYNPNTVGKAEAAKIRKSLQSVGFAVPLVIRPDPKRKGRFIIIDGQHRCAIARELGMVAAPALCLKGLSRKQAKKLTINLNYLHGEPDFEKMTNVIKSLMEDGDTEESIRESIGLSDEAIDQYIAELTISGQDAEEEVEKQSRGIAKAVSTERVIEKVFGPFNKEEARLIDRILEDKALAKFEETKRIVKLFKAGFMALTGAKSDDKLFVQKRSE